MLSIEERYMDFSYSKEQEVLKRVVREFCDKEIAPKAAEFDKTAEFDYGIIEKLSKEMEFINWVEQKKKQLTKHQNEKDDLDDVMLSGIDSMQTYLNENQWERVIFI